MCELESNCTQLE